MKKNLLKLLTSGELIAHFDANSDGRVTWSEIKTAPASAWTDLILKYGLPIIVSLL